MMHLLALAPAERSGIRSAMQLATSCPLASKPSMRVLEARGASERARSQASGSSALCTVHCEMYALLTDVTVCQLCS